MKPLHFLSLCAGALLASLAGAVTFSGSTTTSLLVTDRPTRIDSTFLRVPVFETLAFRLAGIGSERLSFDGSIRGWQDLNDKAAERSDLRLLRARLHWVDRQAGIDASLGRQFVVEGVGRTYLDGLLIRKRISRFSLSGFFGAPLRRGTDDWEYWSGAALQWGAYGRARLSNRALVGVSYTEMQRDEGLGLRLVGADGTARLTDRQTLELRADINAAKGDVDRASAWWLYQRTPKEFLTIEGRYHGPRLLATSFLDSIDHHGYGRLTASYVRPIVGDLRAYVAANGLIIDNSVGATTDVGVWWRSLRVSYLFSTTRAATGHGITLHGSYQITPHLTVGGRTNWARFELDKSDEENQAIGSAAWVTVTPVPRLDLTTEVHEITTDDFDYQFEGLVVVRYRFGKNIGFRR